ncbi:MAG: thiol peroxidase, partial [Shewanella sp.]
DYGLLARAIFIIDAEGKLKYQELVPNITEHPNYDAALEALKTIQVQQ